MRPVQIAAIGAAALLAACVSPYEDARSPEAGTAGTLHNGALNAAPVGPVDSTASVGTQSIYGRDVPPPGSPAVTAGSGSSTVVAPPGAIYYDAYGRAYALDAYGRPYYVTAPGVVRR